MKILLVAVLIAFISAGDAAPAETEVKVEEAQFFWPGMGMGGMGMPGMGMPGMGMPGMGYPGMGFPGFDGMDQNYNSQPMAKEEFPVDYSQSCSNSCRCVNICVRWVPCDCSCPPPCPPATTTTTTTQKPELCPGLPDSYYPYCCPNGVMNPTCEPIVVDPPVTTTTPGPDCPTGDCCRPCQPCMPCMIWWMCRPCNPCNNGCETTTSTTTTTTTTTTTKKPELCPGLPDSYYPYCCPNGMMNPTCEEAPVLETTPAPCVPCRPQCPPCMIWWMCSPCVNTCNNGNCNNCNNGCEQNNGSVNDSQKDKKEIKYPEPKYPDMKDWNKGNYYGQF